MAPSNMSSDEGEIVEATPQPRTQNGDVDRNGRHRGRRSPSHDDGRRRSRSPRGWKRPRDDHQYARDRRDQRPSRPGLGYENGHRDDRRQHYKDLDRPVSHGSTYADDQRHGYHPQQNTSSRLRNHDGYPDKRARTRSKSPRGRRDRGRRDRGMRPEDKYSAQVGSLQDGSTSKRTSHVEQDAKHDQGVTVDRGINGLSNAQQSAAEKEPEVDPDWDPDAAMNQEAAIEAEIERRRRLREATYKRVVGAATPTAQAVPNSEKPSTPTIQALQLSDKPPSTPGSTRQGTPGPQRTEVSTPQSGDAPSPAMSPAAFNFADDQALINAHALSKAADEDGPSAADYDPTADMKADELRDELRHGNVGLHGELRHPSQPEAAVPVEEKKAASKEADDDDEDFDMFADDFDEQKFAVPAAKSALAEDGRPLPPAGGGANLEGDDSDGYYKIRPGEILDGRYQLSTTLGRGMFSGVARGVDLGTKQEVAIKIMRNNDALRKGGFTEIAILEKLNAADADNKKHIVRFQRSFEYKGHLCMVFENLSMNLREVLKKFGNNVGINLNATRAYAYQIFLALAHMRKCSIIHADLKPDNILVNEARNMLKICDLGTAIDRSDAATASNEITPYLVSRFYRAPEVILGMPYDYAIDMWSIGCTLYELYTGKILFTGDSNNQMLKNIQEIRGKISPKIYRRGQLSGMHFDEQGHFVSVEHDKILGKTSTRKLPVIKPSRDLRARLLAASSGMSDSETRELNHFADLLDRCLALNPDKRMTPAEALKHPFFTHRIVQQHHYHGSGR